MRDYRRVRWGVQLGFAALCLWIGYDFRQFYQQVVGGAAVTAARPPGVEAFLPISALLGLKRLILTGQWDDIHPAGLTLLLAFLLGAVAARRVFCSWICPIGTLSRLLETVRRLCRLPERWPVPAWLRRIGPAAKYAAALAVLLKLAGMPLEDIEQFLRMPFNMGADGHMLVWFETLGPTAFTVFGGMVLLSLVVRNGWCRGLCPYGALFGLAALASPVRIVRDPAACRQCGACSQACGMGIRVAEGRAVLSPECTACLACVSVCAAPGALTVQAPRLGKPARRLPPWAMPAAALAILLAAVGLARVTGHWASDLPLEAYRFAYLFGGH